MSFFFFFNKCFSSDNTSEITTFIHSKNEQGGKKIHNRFTLHTLYNLIDEVKLSRSSVNKFTGSRCVWGTNHMRKPRSERAGFRLQLSTLEECLFRLFLHQNFCSTLDVSSTTPFSVPSYLLHLSSLPSSTLGTPLNFRLLPQLDLPRPIHCPVPDSSLPIYTINLLLYVFLFVCLASSLWKQFFSSPASPSCTLP